MPQQDDAEQQQQRQNHSQQLDFPIQALYFLLRCWQFSVVRQGNAVAAHKQPMGIDAVWRTRDKRTEILALHDAQFFHFARQNRRDVVHLIRNFAV